MQQLKKNMQAVCTSLAAKQTTKDFIGEGYNVCMHFSTLESIPFICTAAGEPTGLRATKDSTTISVTWTIPSGGATPTGYVVYFEATDGGTDSGSETVTNGTIKQLLITGRNHSSYDISMVAVSTHLPSSIVGPVSTESEWL